MNRILPVMVLFLMLAAGLACSGCTGSTPTERKIIFDTGTLFLPDAFGTPLKIEGDHGIVYIPEKIPYEGFKNGMKVRFAGTASQSPYYPVQPSIPIELILLRPVPGVEGPIYGIGKVMYVNSERGFYGIAVENGEPTGPVTYYPVDLDREFEKDGITVSFTGEERPDLAGTNQWGTPIFLTRVKKIS